MPKSKQRPTKDDDQALRVLTEASKQYEEYLRISKLSDRSQDATSTQARQQDWAHPVGLVINNGR